MVNSNCWALLLVVIYKTDLGMSVILTFSLAIKGSHDYLPWLPKLLFHCLSRLFNHRFQHLTKATPAEQQTESSVSGHSEK